jgi:hypothetical protein
VSLQQAQQIGRRTPRPAQRVRRRIIAVTIHPLVREVKSTDFFRRFHIPDLDSGALFLHCFWARILVPLPPDEQST